jgi:glutamate formiminotransferase / 5-formyltetrahydrofolate cyclo-ligase
VNTLPLLAVPNVSEGRDHLEIEAIAGAFVAGGAARLLDVHSDPDHHRAVFTLAGRPGSLARALAAGAAEALQRVDIGDGRGHHPHVGAVDVVPVVYLARELRGSACAEALVAADLIGALGVPVFLYGELTGARTRAELRRGGVEALAGRMRSGELRPDFGPSVPHPTAGAALVSARPPLVAFNLELSPPASVADARRIASLIREGGAEGLPGVRAIGVALRRGAGVRERDAAALGERAGAEAGPGGAEGRGRGGSGGSATGGDGESATIPQVSLNVERPAEVPLRLVVEAVRLHAPVARAELVGLAPAVALAGFPVDVPLSGFDPARHVIENALAENALGL